MKLLSLRLFWLGVVPLTLAACTGPGPAAAEQTSGATPLGIDLGSSPTRGLQDRSPGEHHPTHSDRRFSHHEERSGGQMTTADAGHEGAHGTGTVNAVDPAQHKIGLSHEAIPALGWPAMTMEFAVAPAVDLRSMRPGTSVNFTLDKGKDGMYVIQSVTPSAGGR
jgi:Cu(I)/Ag(I) efflux system protein CusF